MQDQDKIIRFIFEQIGIRGEWVNLTESWSTLALNHDYTTAVQNQLGQAMVASVLLSATIKFEGSLILQAQGQGPLTAVVAQCTHDRVIRGLARNSGPVASGDLSQTYGQGRLVLTIEPDNGQPYQGIVELNGDSLAQALETYYAQSEQLKTRLWLFANGDQAAGLLLQELPSSEQGTDADWQRIEMLADTVTGQEIMELSCQSMLYRLFNEESVRVFDAENVRYRCHCSTSKIEQTLISLGSKTLKELLIENNEITVDCEFCNHKYVFDAVDIGKLLSSPISINYSNSHH